MIARKFDYSKSFYEICLRHQKIRSVVHRRRRRHLSSTADVHLLLVRWSSSRLAVRPSVLRTPVRSFVNSSVSSVRQPHHHHPFIAIRRFLPFLLHSSPAVIISADDDCNSSYFSDIVCLCLFVCLSIH